MFGQKTKRIAVKALEALRESNGMAKRFSNCLDESQRLLAETMVLLNRSIANANECSALAETWRRLYEEAHNKPDAVSVCDETKAVNGWVN